MSELLTEIANAPPFALAIGGIVAFAVLIAVLRFVGQVLYVLLTGHVPQTRRACGYGGGIGVEAEHTGGLGRWLFGSGEKEGGGVWFGWGDSDGDGGGDGGGD